MPTGPCAEDAYLPSTLSPSSSPSTRGDAFRPHHPTDLASPGSNTLAVCSPLVPGLVYSATVCLCSGRSGIHAVGTVLLMLGSPVPSRALRPLERAHGQLAQRGGLVCWAYALPGTRTDSRGDTRVMRVNYQALHHLHCPLPPAPA